MTEDAIVFAFLTLFSVGVGYFVTWRQGCKTRRMVRELRKELEAVTRGGSVSELQRLEQAVDAIAVEVERIGEGQRFMTKVLADRTTGARRNDLEALPPSLVVTPN